STTKKTAQRMVLREGLGLSHRLQSTRNRFQINILKTFSRRRRSVRKRIGAHSILGDGSELLRIRQDGGNELDSPSPTISLSLRVRVAAPWRSVGVDNRPTSSQAQQHQGEQYGKQKQTKAEWVAKESDSPW